MRSSARSPAETRFPPLLVICGPTATGKTALSLAVAEALPGTEIVSADSRQVFRGMDVGTAKVGSTERARIPHHGLDLVEPDQPFSAADYRRHALGALEGIAGRGGLAVLVGGTGLYLRAVARGLPLDEVDHDRPLRAELEAALAQHGLPALVDELRRLAPVSAARTDLANPRRVVRALERVRLQGDTPPPLPRGYPGPVSWLGLDTAAATNDVWIAERARWQFANGLLDEAAALAARFDRGLPAFSAMGYREALAVLDGSLSHEEALELTARRTRQFARRQRTWFRREADVEWLDARDENKPRAIAVARALVVEAATRERGSRARR